MNSESEPQPHDDVVLVELAPSSGMRPVALTPHEILSASQLALDNAMNTIRSMANRVSRTMKSVECRPQTVEVEFGLKLTSEAGALIAKASTEAHVVVKLTWGGGEQAAD